ncbi:MAG: hypothetical protein Q9223_001362 [Gallowayella weberi]
MRSQVRQPQMPERIMLFRQRPPLAIAPQPQVEEVMALVVQPSTTKNVPARSAARLRATAERQRNIARIPIVNGPLVTYDEDIYSCTQPKVVALTYDDGPYQYTDQLLNILKSYGFKATFFMTGNNLHKGPIDETAPYPAIIKRMVAEGHQVASHTWSHYSLSNIPSAVRKDQMVKNERAIANIIGKYPTYMRPPYSQCNAQSGCEADMKALGYHRVYFDLDTQDYLNPTTIQNSKDIVKQMLGAVGANADYLSIQHDLVQQSVTNLTSYYFDLIKAKGWKGVTAGECLGDPPANWYRTPGGATTQVSSANNVGASGTSSTTSKTFSTTPRLNVATPAAGPCVVQAGSFCGTVTPFSTQKECQTSAAQCYQSSLACKKEAVQRAMLEFWF